MPVKTLTTEVKRLFADFDKPSLHSLSYALRHPDVWPEDFVWDYSDCASCAMGLAHCLWSEIVREADAKTGPSIMAHAFAMPYSEAKRIFLETGEIGERGFLWRESWSSTTPEMVADQIDSYLHSLSAKSKDAGSKP